LTFSNNTQSREGWGRCAAFWLLGGRDSQAAFAAAAWLRRADLNGSLSQYLNPPLEPEERELAAIEGLIFENAQQADDWLPVATTFRGFGVSQRLKLA
jgi:hypothetical protein